MAQFKEVGACSSSGAATPASKPGWWQQPDARQGAACQGRGCDSRADACSEGGGGARGRGRGGVKAVLVRAARGEGGEERSERKGVRGKGGGGA